MSIKTYRPTTPARRQMTVSGFDGVDKHAVPEKSLVEVLKKHAGRNSYGHITVRHKGGGNRQKYRVIDFKRNDKLGMFAEVLRLWRPGGARGPQGGLWARLRHGSRP